MSSTRFNTPSITIIINKSIKPLEVKDFIDNRLVMVSKYIGVGKDYE